MKRIAVFGIAVLLIICSFTGCAPELHERLLIRAVGVDSIDSGWRVTVRVSDQNESGKEISFTESGNTVAHALERIAQNTGKKPLYSHNALIVFGKICAEDGLKDCLDFFLRHYDSRPTVKVLLSDDTAEEILKIDADAQDVVSSEDIAALLKAEEFSGLAVNADLITLINGTYGANQSTVLPIIRADEEPELGGAAILSDMQLCAELGTEAMRGYLLLSGKLSAGETVFTNASCGKVTVSTDNSSCSIQFTGTKENPQFTVKAEIEGEISSISSGMRKLESSIFPELERQYATAAAESINAYLDTSVFGSGNDAAGLGRAILLADPTVWQAVSADLSEFLKRAEINIEVHAQINRVEEEDLPYL